MRHKQKLRLIDVEIFKEKGKLKRVGFGDRERTPTFFSGPMNLKGFKALVKSGTSGRSV